MVLVNLCVGWVPRRRIDTNQPQILQGHGPPHPAYSSDLRHTSQFPHHSTSNLCTYHISILVVIVNLCVGWVPRRSMRTNQTQILQGHAPPHPAYSSDLRHTSQFPHHSTSNLCTCHPLFQMVLVNLYVGCVPRRSMGTNQTQVLQGHRPPHPAYSSDLRHTSQFPHHSTSNLCTCHPLFQMVLVNLYVGCVPRRSMSTNQTQILQGHGPPHPAYSSDLRHTSQFPHHSTSNLCTCNPLFQMVLVNLYVGCVPRRSMGTNQTQILQGHGPPHPACSSDLRHTLQFPHHSTSNLCTCNPWFQMVL